jgi:hypothetical protein
MWPGELRMGISSWTRAGWHRSSHRCSFLARLPVSTQRRRHRLEDGRPALALLVRCCSCSHEREKEPNLDAARFDLGWGELSIDWPLGFFYRFGHVLHSIKAASYALLLFQLIWSIWWTCCVISAGAALPMVTGSIISQVMALPRSNQERSDNVGCSGSDEEVLTGNCFNSFSIRCLPNSQFRCISIHKFKNMGLLIWIRSLIYCASQCISSEIDLCSACLNHRFGLAICS